MAETNRSTGSRTSRTTGFDGDRSLLHIQCHWRLSALLPAGYAAVRSSQSCLGWNRLMIALAMLDEPTLALRATL